MQQFDASVGAFFFSSETSDCGYDTRNGFTTMPAAFAFGTVRFSPYHFTGKERDTESGNDYFGARYYSSSMGRFMSPDWSAKYEPVPYAKLDNPQTLNLYAYVGNNPLNRTDPTGHYEIGCGSGVKNCDKQMKNTNDAVAKGLKSKDPKVVAAAKAYGKLGEKNGVNVTIVNVVDAKNANVTGNTSGSLQLGTDGVNAVMQNTQVNIKAGMSSDDLSDTVVHEGSHVEDHAGYAAAVNALQDPTGQLAKAMNVTGKQSEMTAYGVENANRAQRGAAPIDIQNQLSNPPYSTNPDINKGIFDAPY
jgi:RHS repeat-associated protein